MNEITIHGNLTAEPVTHRKADRIALSFAVAVNNGYHDRTGRWIKQPAVYHQIACFGALAANAAESLHKGTTVTITGHLTDDSYTDDRGNTQRRTRLVATDIALSLRWATATTTRTTTRTPNPDPEHGTPAEQPTDPDTNTDAEDGAEDVAGAEDGQPPANPVPAGKRTGRRVTTLRRTPTDAGQPADVA
jgi:single-strand DNA-binding protein